MNWLEIAERYRRIGGNLIIKTNEGTTGVKDGLGNGTEDYNDIRRVHKILLRIGFEFLVKSLYLKKGWNICKFNKKPKIRFIKLTEVEGDVLDLYKTIEFKKLIDKLNLIISNYGEITHLKEELHKIREEGNLAIHNDNVSTAELSKIKEIEHELYKIINEENKNGTL